MALFCEDIREEINGVISLVGIMPDNVNVAKVSGDSSDGNKSDPTIRVLSKFCIFVRINFDPDFDLPEAKLMLVPSEGQPTELGKIDRKTIDRAREQAKAKGNLLAGVVSRAVLGGFPLPQAGSLKLEIVFPEETHIAGAIKFHPHLVPAISSTEH